MCRDCRALSPKVPRLKGAKRPEGAAHGSAEPLAVNSYVTNWNCSGVGYANRVDRPEVLNWINGSHPEAR